MFCIAWKRTTQKRHKYTLSNEWIVLAWSIKYVVTRPVNKEDAKDAKPSLEKLLQPLKKCVGHRHRFCLE